MIGCSSHKLALHSDCRICVRTCSSVFILYTIHRQDMILWCLLVSSVDILHALDGGGFIQYHKSVHILHFVSHICTVHGSPQKWCYTLSHWESYKLVQYVFVVPSVHLPLLLVGLSCQITAVYGSASSKLINFWKSRKRCLDLSSLKLTVRP